MKKDIPSKEGVLITAAIRDLATRKKAEDALPGNADYLRRVIDAIPGFVWSASPDGSIAFLNQRGLDYTGFSLEQIKGWNWRDTNILHPDDMQSLFETWSAIVASGDPGEIQARMRRFDGEYRWFLNRFNPLRDEAGRVMRWYATGTDIDDRKQAEEKVQKENLARREEIDKTSMFEEIVGASPALQTVLSHVAKVAPMDSTVLITGEIPQSGTKSLLLARFIRDRHAPAAPSSV